MDLDGPAPSGLWGGLTTDEELGVEVPQLPTLLQPNDFRWLSYGVDSLQDSDDSGVDLYLQALQFISSCNENG